MPTKQFMWDCVSPKSYTVRTTHTGRLPITSVDGNVTHVANGTRTQKQDSYTSTVGTLALYMLHMCTTSLVR